jgi:hypothetical protein
MDERARRIAENQALFRSINERIVGLNDAFGPITESMVVICECGDVLCVEQLYLDIPTYERVRSDATQFVVRPGHEIPEEEVLMRTETFCLVRKYPGLPAEIATDLDPRS